MGFHVASRMVVKEYVCNWWGVSTPPRSSTTTLACQAITCRGSSWSRLLTRPSHLCPAVAHHPSCAEALPCRSLPSLTLSVALLLLMIALDITAIRQCLSPKIKGWASGLWRGCCFQECNFITLLQFLTLIYEPKPFRVLPCMWYLLPSPSFFAPHDVATLTTASASARVLPYICKGVASSVITFIRRKN